MNNNVKEVIKSFAVEGQLLAVYRYGAHRRSTGMWMHCIQQDYN